MNQEIISLLKAALECSVFINPTEPGTTKKFLNLVRELDISPAKSETRRWTQASGLLAIVDLFQIG